MSKITHLLNNVVYNLLLLYSHCHCQQILGHCFLRLKLSKAIKNSTALIINVLSKWLKQYHSVEITESEILN